MSTQGSFHERVKMPTYMWAVDNRLETGATKTIHSQCWSFYWNSHSETCMPRYIWPVLGWLANTEAQQYCESYINWKRKAAKVYNRKRTTVQDACTKCKE